VKNPASYPRSEKSSNVLVAVASTIAYLLGNWWWKN